MTAKLTIALALLLGASSAALAANHHRHYYGPHHGYRYGAWQRGYGGMLPNDTSRSFEYQMDMGQWSGKINAR